MAGGGTKVIAQAIAGNSFITIIKFIGWFFSKSPSLLAEAIHSLADTFNQILLLIGIKQSVGDPTREHPTGKGGSTYLWNLISSVGIFFLGFGLTFYHGIHALLSGNYEVGPVSYIGIGVLVVSFIIEFYILIQAYKEVKSQMGSKSFIQFFKESDDPAVVAVLLEDGVAVFGVFLALMGIGLGQVFQTALFDIFASIAIALLLGFLAIALGFINSKLLIGKSVNLHKESEIQSYIENLEQVQRVHKLSTKVMGAGQVRLSIEIELTGEKLIDNEALKADAKRIEAGEQALKVLHKSSERMVRLTGEAINKMEVQIHEKFPEVSIIDFEIN